MEQKAAEKDLERAEQGRAEMIGHGITRECYKCLCRVCGAAECPHKLIGYPNRCSARCWFQRNGFEPHPILDCDFFYFKICHKFRIRRIYKIPEVRYVDQTNADDIRVMLAEVLQLLKSGSAPADVNCVRNNCLCLQCPVSDQCQDRCKYCRSYRGERPVKLCGRRLQVLKEMNK